jgi:superfamily II DNA/RNA helicase
MRFEDFDLHDELLDALHYMKFEEATPIQVQAIPAILEGRDLIACAQTGTGKTAAFMLPLLDKLSSNPVDFTDTLVLVPTRELALQIDQQVQGFSYFLGVDAIAVYGGGDAQDWEQQRKALTSGVNIVVATPGKLISHLNMGYVKFDKVQHLVLDEADRMLDMGFFEDIMKILSYLPAKRQNLLFSATMPPAIKELASHLLKDPVEITLALSKPAEGVLQAAYLCYPAQKVGLVKWLIEDKPHYESVLIFTSTKRMIFDIVRAIKNPAYQVEGISSDLDQREREEVLMRFRARKTRVLVATDVLARGIDIKDINLVINFDVPQDAEDYVHRVGRTARANTTGVAITLVSDQDMMRFARIEKLIGRSVAKSPAPPHLGESPVWLEKSGPKKKKGPRRNKR